MLRICGGLWLPGCLQAGHFVLELWPHPFSTMLSSGMSLATFLCGTGLSAKARRKNAQKASHRVARNFRCQNSRKNRIWLFLNRDNSSQLEKQFPPSERKCGSTRAIPEEFDNTMASKMENGANQAMALSWCPTLNSRHPSRIRKSGQQISAVSQVRRISRKPGIGGERF